MSIDPSTGVLSWAPTEAQGPSTNQITVKVTDNGAPPLSDTKSFTVVVNEVNSAPLLPTQGERSMNELTTLVVTNTASDGDIPANGLTYQLVSPPAWAKIDAKGFITLTPKEADGPSTNMIVIVATDNGLPQLTATNSFVVTVNEVNSAPVLPAQSTRTLAEQTVLMVTNSASDADSPANVLTYQLVNPPTGASIDTRGVITWTSSEAQGPSTNMITTVVTDDGVPSLSATNAFKVIVTEVNSPPVLTVPDNQTITELSTLMVTNTASDSDLPVNTLTFSLVSRPAGMSIDPSTGVLSWTPTVAQGPNTNLITVKVTDNGAPPLSDTKSFTVNIVTPSPVIQSVGVAGDSLTFTWSAIAGKIYQLQYKSDLAETSWNPVPGDVVATGGHASKADVIILIGRRFYRVVALP